MEDSQKACSLPHLSQEQPNRDATHFGGAFNRSTVFRAAINPEGLCENRTIKQSKVSPAIPNNPRSISIIKAT